MSGRGDLSDPETLREFASMVAEELRAMKAVEQLVARLDVEADERFDCVRAPGSDLVVQTDAGLLAARAAAYSTDEQVVSVHDPAVEEVPWQAVARWNPLTGDMSIGYADPEQGWVEHIYWRVVNDTGDPWPDAPRLEAEAAGALKATIVAKGQKLIEDSYRFDELIERWIELGLDRRELQDAIEDDCGDAGTNIEEFVTDRVAASFEPASENVMYHDGFGKALEWWRSSGIGPREAFDCLVEPVYGSMRPLSPEASAAQAAEGMAAHEDDLAGLDDARSL